MINLTLAVHAFRRYLKTEIALDHMKIPAPNYAEAIDVLVTRLLTGEKEDIEPLLVALGCRSSAGHSMPVPIPEQPSPADEYLVQATLQQAIRWHSSVHGYISDGIALLDGLIRNDRWRECLKSTDGAIILSALLMNFAVGQDHAKSLHSTIKPDVCRLLNAWLCPVVPLEDLLLPTELARVLFGDAWYDLHIGDRNDERVIGRFVLKCIPPFRPGLLAEHLNDRVEPLPELDMA